MPVVVLFIIFILLLVIAVPVSITLGITSVLPSVCDPSFTVGAKYLIRAMFGGLDSFPLLAVPMFVLSGIIMAKGGISKKLFNAMRCYHDLPVLRCDLRICSCDCCSRRKYDHSDP